MAAFAEIVFPESQQEGTESVIATWLKKPGEHVAMHEPIVEVSTDKVTVEIPSPGAGILAEILKQENENIEPGAVLGRIELAEAASAPAAQQSTHAPATSGDTPRHGSQAELSPAVRRLVAEHNIDVTKVLGTGKGGRITVDDITKHLEGAPAAPATGGAAQGGRMVPHSTMRRSVARNMVESMLRTAPHVTAVFEADLSAVASHRQRHAAEFERQGVKLTYTAYFVVAACQALAHVPEVNSRWHEDALELYEDCNIGIATAIEQGLIVPVIDRAQELDLFGVASKLRDLTEKARGGALKPADVQRGTFTITNHGVSGSLIATPIILQPQSAILGIGKLEKRAKVEETAQGDKVVVRPMAYVTLTIDHRVLDGFLTNRFLSKFVEVLEGWPT